MEASSNSTTKTALFIIASFFLFLVFFQGGAFIYKKVTKYSSELEVSRVDPGSITSANEDRTSIVRTTQNDKTVPSTKSDPKDIKSLSAETPTTPVTPATPPAQQAEKIDHKKVSVTSQSTDKGVTLTRLKLGISDDKISQVLEEISRNMEAQNLIYSPSLGQDCSGIFHRVKDSLMTRIPKFAVAGPYKYPVFNKQRSSRQIAHWFYRNNNLLIIKNPIASRNSIRPGSVMFFGKPNKKYKNLTIEKLTDGKNGFTSKGIIMHVAIVTSVNKDKQNNVIGYTMMHGRNTGTPASRSSSSIKQSKHTKGLPAFGNWSQQWVAVANIVTPE